MSKIVSCRVCNNRGLTEFLDLGKQPYANALSKSPKEKEKFYPLSLSWCPNCNLVQLNHTANPKELFSNYVWVTATSSTAREHAEYFFKEVVSRTGKSKDGYVLEVASNDGTFLIPFIKNGYKVLGIDPAQNITEVAEKNGIPTWCEFFGVHSARKVKRKLGLAKVVIARNVLPHVANLHDFVEGLNESLADDGLLVLEIHYAKKIYDELHYDSIYHEHLCYFTLKSLEFLLNKANFFVEDLIESPISGGSLVIFARKGKTKELSVVRNYRKKEDIIKVNGLKSWQSFAIKVRSHRDKLLKILKKNKTGLIVGYGASARSSTLLNYCRINHKLIPVIADQNPLKQGLYTAGTHILIDSPDKVMKMNPQVIVILAWNFQKEIIKFLNERYHFRGKYIIPLPNNPKVLS